MKTGNINPKISEARKLRQLARTNLYDPSPTGIEENKTGSKNNDFTACPSIVPSHTSMQLILSGPLRGSNR